MVGAIDREMEAFRAALRRRGLSVTRQRLRIAETVFSTHKHFSADDLARWVRKRDPRVGRVTVWRMLKVLVEAGLVEERPFRRDRMLYEHVIGHRHHDHMVCLRCGRIVEFENPRIEKEQARSAREHGFTVVSHHHTLFGYCRACGSGGTAKGRGTAATAGRGP
jgi:Fur family ferric uptake transcriptional regulator